MKSALNATFWASLFWCALGCPPTPTPDPPPKPVVATCATACANASELRCSWAMPTAGGASCEDVCKAAQDFGDAWDLACRTAAVTCAAADRCEL